MKGAVWTLGEETKLLTLFLTRKSALQIAKTLDRSVSAVTSRLCFRGCIIVVGKAYHRIELKPYATFAEINLWNKHETK